MFRGNGCEICYQVNSLRCIVGTARCEEAWQPPFPVAYDLGPIFPSNSMSEINIIMNKPRVGMTCASAGLDPRMNWVRVAYEPKSVPAVGVSQQNKGGI